LAHEAQVILEVNRPVAADSDMSDLTGDQVCSLFQNRHLVLEPLWVRPVVSVGDSHESTGGDFQASIPRQVWPDIYLVPYDNNPGIVEGPDPVKRIVGAGVVNHNQLQIHST
jgi:hypothetical protein